MNEQNVLTHGSKKIFASILAVLLIVFFTGSGVYLWQQSRSQATEAALEAQVAALQEKLADTEACLAVEPSQPLPSACEDQAEGTPVITSLSAYAGPIGTALEIRGCNFAGFEGDKNAWIENDRGEKGLLYGASGSTAKLLRVNLSLPLCQEDTSYSGKECEHYLALEPGTYEIYALPWDQESNRVKFTIE